MAKNNTCYVKYKNRYHPYNMELIKDDDFDSMKISVPSLDFEIEYPVEGLTEFLNEFSDILEAFEDMDKEEEAEARENKSRWLRVRVSPEEKKLMAENARKQGYKNTSAFIRELALK